jgi:dienelactone hydrolase
MSSRPFTRRAFLAAGAAIPAAGVAQSVEALPGTQPLTMTGDFREPMLAGAHRFVDRKIAESLETRQRHWKRDFSSAEAYERSVAANRKRFLEKIGAVDSLLPASLETIGDDAGGVILAETPAYRVYAVRWDALEGVHGEGLRLEPKGRPVAQVVAVPDADQTPEQISGLDGFLPPAAQFARVLAESGCRVLVPATIDRTSRWSGRPELKAADQTPREWIYRQAFHMGRHVIGYEVQKVRAAVGWFGKVNASIPVGVAGYGEGGLVAFYSAAADPRIAGVLVAGYFTSREKVWAEPIYRNVWGLLEEFGDAELASLVAPRGLAVVFSRYPEVHNQKGDLVPPPFAEVEKELVRIDSLVKPGFQRRSLIAGPNGSPVEPGSPAAVSALLQLLTGRPASRVAAATPLERRRTIDAADRQRRQAQELENHVQGLVRASEHVRERFYLLQAEPGFGTEKWTTALSVNTKPAEPFIAASERFRGTFRREVMGQFDEPYLPPNPRSRKVRETERWTGYDVVLDVWPEFFTMGTLLVPKGLRAGERRPVVVCQHGRHGQPWDTIDPPGAYNQFAAKLADRGFIVFAPQNIHALEDRYRWLSRKTNGIKASMFSVIIAQHEQALRWLGGLPFVDPARIAFYGLSYGGETAMRVPAALKGYSLSICSGDFNNWAWKVASTDEEFSFMYSIEWEMPYFNMGNTFDYAEMAYLIFPRPFMVERGHYDRVGRDRWVAYEYAKVRRLYAAFGMAERTAIEYFHGGHAVNAKGAFEFLHEHLNWTAAMPGRP